jgi:hypothetical protein
MYRYGIYFVPLSDINRDLLYDETGNLFLNELLNFSVLAFLAGIRAHWEP